MKLKKSYSFLFGIFVLALLFYSSFNLTSPIKLIDAKSFEEKISQEDVFVINAHTSYAGEIKGTDLIAENWEDMGSYLNVLPKKKDTKILIYCRSGRMSGISAEKLVELGYTNIYDLEGGMNSWVASGRKLNYNEDNFKGEIKAFDLEIESWSFNPPIIEVNEGDLVTLNLKTISGYHGFFLPDFGISESLNQGEEISVKFIANKKGQFNFYCNVSCGSGHRKMRGLLKIN